MTLKPLIDYSGTTMTAPADYHMHTPLCHHATGEPTEYAAQALAVGLDEIGFSDHAPMRQDNFDDWRMNLDDLDDYVARIEHAREAHPELTIRLALEVDYLPGQEPWIRELATRHPWDYLIGSVHYLTDSWVIDNPAQKSEWNKSDPVSVWTRYGERLTTAAASGLFDIISHIDLPKKFGRNAPKQVVSIYRPFFQAAQEHDVAIELNTGGLRKDCREIYPSEALLTEAFRHHVPITLGSDSHAPNEVGSDFEAAITLARRVGYTHTCRFTARQRRLVPL